MKRLAVPFLVVLALLLTACGSSSSSTATSAPAATKAPAAATAAPAATTAAPVATTAAGSVAAPSTSATAPAASAAASSGAPVALSGQPIPIGLGIATTSNVALLGEEEKNGGLLAEKFFNDRGGVNGRPIKVVLQDTAGDEQGAINAFQSLISKDKVVGIVGPTLSQQAFAADPSANSAKVPVVGPSDTAKGIPQIGEYVTRVSAPVSAVAPNAVKQALKINPNIKNVAVFYAQNDAFSVSETDTFQSTAKSLNLNVTTVQKFQTTDTDFQTQVTNALATKPDLAIVSGLAADGGNLVKQLRELGFKGVIIGGNGLNTSNIFTVCKAQCDGILIAQAYSPALKSDINDAFKKVYTDQFKKDPPQFAAQTFTGIQVFVDALKSLDSKNKIANMSLDDLRVALNTELHAGKYDTPLGTISFDKDRELVQTNFYVAQIKMNPDGVTGTFVFLS
ncbi:MAG: ABC transporter substrate-binding protein [Chloroflexota bacterium]|nr:ABC transporter substrate-binding protein [Chloroflexota bacterium]